MKSSHLITATVTVDDSKQLNTVPQHTTTHQQLQSQWLNYSNHNDLSIILAVFPPAFAVTFLFRRCQYKLPYSYTFYLVKHQLLESPITSAVTTHLTSQRTHNSLLLQANTKLAADLPRKATCAVVNKCTTVLLINLQ